MSTTRFTEKPKRPLSGYNLFYRYKRNVILEATADFVEGVSSEEEKEVISSVLHALPGLEGVPANHPVWSFSSQVRNELRAANIRTAMQGKLLPNENNTRSRLHRKVHGIGFIEMAKIMRSMWADTDKFTEQVFLKLADVGRVTYRARMKEYKLQVEDQESKMVPVMDVDCTSSRTIFGFAVSEATPKSTEKPARVMICQAISSPSPSYEKNNSHALDSLEPIPISPKTLQTCIRRPYGRRVSNDISDRDFSPDIVQQFTRACQEIDSEFGHLLASTSPLPLFQLGASSDGPTAFSRRRMSDWSIHSRLSSSDSELEASSCENEKEVDTEDMLALIGDLDDALESEGPSMIFGKPVHDVTMTHVSTRTA